MHTIDKSEEHTERFFSRFNFRSEWFTTLILLSAAATIIGVLAI